MASVTNAAASGDLVAVMREGWRWFSEDRPILSIPAELAEDQQPANAGDGRRKIRLKIQKEKMPAP